MRQQQGRQLTVGAVERLGAGAIVWDSRVNGFGVRCQGKAKTYFLKTRVAGRQCWISIGQHGSPWTVQTARIEARRLLVEIAGGANPALAKARARGMPTVAAFADVFLNEHVDVKLKPTTAAHYRDLLRLHIVPMLGRLRIVNAGEKLHRRAGAKIHHRGGQEGPRYRGRRRKRCKMVITSGRCDWLQQVHSWRMIST